MSNKTNPAYFTPSGKEFARGKTYHVDPLDLRIIGGANFVVPEERGPLDTDHIEHALIPPDLHKPLDPAFVETVRRKGVLTGLVIAAIDGVATTLEGRNRARAARVVNVERRANGDLPIIVKCTTQTGGEAEHASVMLIANFARKEWTALDRLQAAQKVMATGVDPATAAMHVGLTLTQLEALLAIDGSTIELRAAVEGGLSVTAAAELTKVRDPERQRAAVQATINAGGTVRAAKREGAVARGKDATPKTMGRVAALDLLGRVKGDDDYAAGARAALDAVLGAQTEERFDVLVEGKEQPQPKKAGAGVIVRYCGHNASFLADVYEIGGACVVVASGPLQNGHQDGSGLQRPASPKATLHLVDFPQAGYWQPRKGIFVVPSAQLRFLKSEDKS